MKISNYIKGFISKKKQKNINLDNLVIGGSCAGYKMCIFRIEEFLPKYAPIMSEIIYYRSNDNRICVMMKDMTFSGKKNINTELFTLPLEKGNDGWFLSYKNMRLKAIPYEEFKPEKIISETRTIFRRINKKIFIIFINDIVIH